VAAPPPPPQASLAADKPAPAAQPLSPVLISAFIGLGVVAVFFAVFGIVMAARRR